MINFQIMLEQKLFWHLKHGMVYYEIFEFLFFLLKGKPFQGKKADVWACASTLFYLLIGKLPFFASNADDLKKKIQEEKFIIF